MLSPDAFLLLGDLIRFERVGPDRVAGTPTTRWAFEGDMPAFADQIQMLDNASRRQLSGSLGAGADFTEVVRTGQMTGGLWVTNEGGYLKRFQLNLAFDIPTGSNPLTGSRRARKIALAHETVVVFSRHNQPVNITPPAGAPPPRRTTPRVLPTPRATATPTR